MKKRYKIGIDLGTTNCALAYCDTLSEKATTQILKIPQLHEIGQIIEQETLPSCYYIATPQEIKKDLLKTPWNTSEEQYINFAVGAFAKNKISSLPERVVQSAKSWLSFADIDRSAPILPWGSDSIPSKEKISPLEASAYYLDYLRQVWNATIAKDDPDTVFEKQDVTITVPASFDEVAQHLTLEAASKAAYPQDVRLLEEPQAAFYSWLEKHQLSEYLPTPSSTILICDVGGGTTDFSLFKITPTKKNNDLSIERIAVSNHILLGGDNIDLTLALDLEKKLQTSKLSTKQWQDLVFQARLLKERVLSDTTESEETTYYVSILSAGSELFSSTLSTSITRKEIYSILLDGFFPLCSADATPTKKLGGLKEFGLPYVNDTAITKHLAAFLKDTPIDAVLFNGGTLKPLFLQTRILETLTTWQKGRPPILLPSDDMDLSVACGAARFGKILQDKIGKISGGYPRSVYLELQSDGTKKEPELLCLLPKGFESGGSVTIKQHSFMLTVNQPARFQLFNSGVRPSDKAGDIVQLNHTDFHPILPPLQTIIPLTSNSSAKDGAVNVIINSVLTETGLLELFCVTKGGKPLSKISFSLKNSATSKKLRHSDEVIISKDTHRSCSDLILKYYGKPSKTTPTNTKQTPKTLIRDLEKITELERTSWPLPFLRALWKDLAVGLTRRNRSLAHECTWLNLAGFILRPGFGSELDDFRITELWRVFELGLAFPKEQSAQIQWAIMWRRVAGGLNRERQNALFAVITRQLNTRNSDNPELFRLAAALERIDMDFRMQIGDLIVRRLLRSGLSGQDQFCWALGRVASRVPLYAELNSVVVPSKVMSWFKQLDKLDWNKPPYEQLKYACLQATRLTNDRVRDISDADRRYIIEKMKQSRATTEEIKPITEFVEFKEADQSILFGEKLPAGLKRLN
ncbi:MAG: Hsp70 family protein [Bdellovibrionota bacterium]|jgi:molecular chaperone DnaK (HSP70)